MGRIIDKIDEKAFAYKGKLEVMEEGGLPKLCPQALLLKSVR